MKAPHIDNPGSLTKWLLIVALLCSLLAGLGGDINSQNSLPVSVKTELAMATTPSVKQAQLVQERQCSSRFFTLNQSSQFAYLRTYNERVTHQLKIVRWTTFSFTRFALVNSVKTIPASADEPKEGSPRG
jgi:hypothetical protein